MKRTVPLLITAVVGFTLIVAYFIPYTQSWGETVAIWFDVLAAIAFILGGGNLLRNASEENLGSAARVGYSIIVLVSFLGTLFVGLGKIGVEPVAAISRLSAGQAPTAQIGQRLLVLLSIRVSAADGDDLRAAGVLHRLGRVPRVPREESRSDPAARHGVHRSARADVCRRGADQLDRSRELGRVPVLHRACASKT